jgi:hypothetical protein
MTARGTTRRDAIAGLAAGTGAVALPGAAAAALNHAERLASLMRDRRSAAAIGRRVLASWPEEAAVDRLVALLAPALATRDTVAGRTALTLALAEDFVGGRVRSVEGAVLAETETRLCALCALLDGKAAR